MGQTGSLAVSARPEEPRSLTLLPPVHIAVADPTRLVPDLFDALLDFYGVNAPSVVRSTCQPAKKLYS